MPDKNPRSARVVHVAGAPETPLVTVLVGAAEHELEWSGTAPAPGDIFRASAGDPPVLFEKIGAAAPGAWRRDGDALRWRRRGRSGATRMELLWRRHRIRRAVRDHLDEAGFIEIDTPLLVRGTSPDATIASFAVGERHLVPSAEYQIKRLEAGGFDRVYTLTQNFRRDDGAGTTRNPEFTMLEWARVGQDLAAIEQDAEALVRRAHAALGGSGTLSFNGHEIDLAPPWERQSVAEAVERQTKVALGDFSADALCRALSEAGVAIRESWKDDVAFLFSLLMGHVQPTLGLSRPLFLRDWPSFETASTAARGATGVAERSELFIGGLEIADGFPTLTDPVRQAETFAFQLERRRRAGTEPVPLDQAYLEALRSGLPQGAGMALGFDRLVMALTGQREIRSVLAFAWDEL